MAKFSVEEARELAVQPPVKLDQIDPASTPGFNDSKKDALEASAAIEEELLDLQTKLYANHRAETPGTGSVLIVLQGMDTSGKGGVVKNVVGPLDPQGVKITGFGKPTKEELSHDFLWRIRKALPEPGYIGVFDRSHYEDVLVHRVHSLSTPEVIEERYGIINEFEKELTDNGVRIIKIFLHISKEFQKENLLERLNDPAKHWKYNPGDVDERGYWDQYQEAYEIAMDRTSTDYAPWYVIPSDNKPYARMAAKYLLLGELREMNLDWPAGDFDVAAELKRVEEA